VRVSIIQGMPLRRLLVAIIVMVKSDWYRLVRDLGVCCSALVVVVLLFVLPVGVAWGHPAWRFERRLGSPGSGAGELSLVGLGNGGGVGSGLAVSFESGEVYVGDTQNRRVDVFSKSGAFVLAFGKSVDVTTGGDVCTAASEDVCGKGAEGSSPGELAAPTFVAVDNSCALHEPALTGSECEAFDPSNGDVYVADAKDDVVSKFTVAGALASSWGSGGQLRETPVLAEGTGDVTAGSSTITSVTTDSGEFQLFQTLVGEGIPTGAKIGEIKGNTLALAKERQAEATKAGVALSARYVFGELGGIAVDASGDLWVYSADGNGGAHMLEFAQGGAFVRAWKSPVGITPVGIALASASHDLYVSADVGVVKLTLGGTTAGFVEMENFVGDGGILTGLAADPTSGDLFVDSGPNSFPGLDIRLFPGTCEAEDTKCHVCEPAGESACTPEESFGGNGEPVGDRLVDGQGVAVGPEERVVVADAGVNNVVAFKQVQLPNVLAGRAEGLSDAGATLLGTVNPVGVALGECYFEYGPTEAYGQRVECEPTATEIGAHKGPVDVNATVSGLSSGFEHFRLVAGNANGVERGEDGSIGASVDSSDVVSASVSGATLEGRIDPHGYETSCSLQYVNEAAFVAEGFAQAASAMCSPMKVGSGESDVPVQAEVPGLTAATAYRFRFLASVSGAAGERTTTGPEGVFVTYPSLVFSDCPNEALRGQDDSQTLPDCRAFERVSSSDNSEAYATSLPVSPEDGVTSAEAPFQSAGNGEGVVFVGESASSGKGEGTGGVGGGEGDEHIATRTATGWEQADIQPGGSGPDTLYEGFDAEVTSGLLRTGFASEPLGEGLSPYCLYSRETSGHRSITPVFAAANCGEPFVVGMAEKGPGVVFESRAAVGGAKAATGEGHDNIYDYGEGALHLVNVLPGASPPADPNATAGSLSSEPAVITFGVSTPAVSVANVVSESGARVFWTDLETGIVYVRLNPLAPPSHISGGKCTQAADACTVQVSAGAATYWAASAEGRYAYYVEGGELWRFDTEADTRTAITGAGAGVQGVIGVNQTGQEGEEGFVYFVAEGALATHPEEAEARKCQAADPSGSGGEPTEAQQEEEGLAPAGRGCNLYVAHSGATSLVAVLLPRDNDFAGSTLSNPQPVRGDWSRVLGYRSAQLTPDGEALVFTSERRLTGYDNVNIAGECGRAVHVCAEVYEYRYGASGGVVCVSCAPSGVAPAGAEGRGARGLFLPFEQTSVLHTPRVVSSDGSRVFFDSAFPLTPGAGGHMGVFEWEAAGSGDCVGGSVFDGGGCLWLLAGGEAGPAYLSETDESGDNVFFVTRAGRVPGESPPGEVPGLFDARVEGGFPAPLEEVVCRSVESCSPWRPEGRVFGGFGSGVGPGNVLVAEPHSQVPRPPGLTPKQRLARALTACRKGRSKRRRLSCERAARARYEREIHPRKGGRKGRKSSRKGRGGR
jgi:hypothetical protein